MYMEYNPAIVIAQPINYLEVGDLFGGGLRGNLLHLGSFLSFLSGSFLHLVCLLLNLFS